MTVGTIGIDKECDSETLDNNFNMRKVFVRIVLKILSSQ